MQVVISTPVFATNFSILPISFIPDEYTHDIAADVGYRSANITVASNMVDIAFWLTYGLGAHVESYGNAAEKIWEGFVDTVSFTFGPLSLSRGPLTEIANRVTVHYTDNVVNQAARTTALNDTASQGRYGIWHKILNTSNVSSTTAEKLRATYLQEFKLPETTSNLSSTGNESHITLGCLGYGSFLEYPYNEATDTTYTAREKILEVLGDDPNNVFSTDYSNIEANSLSVNRLDNDDRNASTIIKELVDLGGASDNNRRTFTIYDNRICYLQAVPSAIEYELRLSSSALIVTDATSGTIVEPYNLRPGKWLRINDFLSDTASTVLRDDPRMIFIENVNFSAPYDFTINGGKLGTLAQQLAKLGLSN